MTPGTSRATLSERILHALADGRPRTLQEIRGIDGIRMVATTLKRLEKFGRVKRAGTRPNAGKGRDPILWQTTGKSPARRFVAAGARGQTLSQTILSALAEGPQTLSAMLPLALDTSRWVAARRMEEKGAIRRVPGSSPILWELVPELAVLRPYRYRRIPLQPDWSPAMAFAANEARYMAIAA